MPAPAPSDARAAPSLQRPPATCSAEAQDHPTSRTATEDPEEREPRLRTRRISGESGGGIRRSRARTRIAAAACSAARPTKKAAAAAPTATSNDTAGMSSGPNGSCPTISFGATRWASHAASTKIPTANPIRPTLKRVNRATRRRSGISSAAKASPPVGLAALPATPSCPADRPEPTPTSSTNPILRPQESSPGKHRRSSCELLITSAGLRLGLVVLPAGSAEPV